MPIPNDRLSIQLACRASHSSSATRSTATSRANSSSDAAAHGVTQVSSSQTIVITRVTVHSRASVVTFEKEHIANSTVQTSSKSSQN